MRDERRCEQFKELLPGLLDGDLPADRAAAVRAHLEGCPACRGSLEALTGLERGLGRLPLLIPDGAAVAAAVTGRLGLGRRSRTAALLRRLPLERIALPLGIAAIALSTYRFIGSMAGRMAGAFAGALSGLAEAARGLAAPSPAAIDPLVVYALSALTLTACAALSLTALRIVRR